MRKYIIALLMLSILLSGSVLAAEKNYKAEEVGALRSFMEETDSDGKTNGSKMNPEWNPDDPSTYGGVVWQDNDGDGIFQVRDIQISVRHLKGQFDVSGFTQLSSLSCSGTVTEEKNGIKEVKITDCENLLVLSVTNTGIESLKLDNLPKLKVVVLNNNALSTLSVEGTSRLVALSLKENHFYQNELPVFNYVNEDQYAPQNVLGERQSDKSWSIGKTGNLAGLGAKGARFTIFTEDGKTKNITDPQNVNLSSFEGQEIYLEILKDGYTPLITNKAHVTDGTFDYPEKPEEGENQKPIIKDQGTSASSQSPNTGVLSDTVSLWVCVVLLILLIGSGFVYRFRRQQ